MRQPNRWRYKVNHHQKKKYSKTHYKFQLYHLGSDAVEETFQVSMQTFLATMFGLMNALILIYLMRISQDHQ